MRVRVERLSVHRDERGELYEPLAPELLGSQRNVHVVMTRPEGIRGNHYHKHGTETFVLEGPALVRVREGGDVRDLAVPPHEVHRFTIPPGVAHAIQNKGDRAGLIVAFNTHPHDRSAPDVVREVLIPG